MPRSGGLASVPFEGHGAGADGRTVRFELSRFVAVGAGGEAARQTGGCFGKAGEAGARRRRRGALKSSSG
eukprot:5943125-Alexandrium_andersonii.AAC.1